jgi:hypothetical protein
MLMTKNPSIRFFSFFFLLSFLSWGWCSAQADSGGLQTSVSVDIVGSAFAREKGSPASKLGVREAEVFFYAPIDPLFDGVLGLAAHQEGGAALFEIHEATLGSSKLIPWSRFRVGQFFLGVGKLNSVHRHDWPFTSAPRVHKEFFGEEGADDTGLEYSVLPPLPVYFDLTVGITNGWKYGHVHNSGKEPKTPTHYVRLANFVGLPSDGGLQSGLNYLGRTDSEGTNTTLMGLDLTAKWREGKQVPFFLQGEVWHRKMKPKDAPPVASLGFYVFPRLNLIPGLDLGMRCDGYTVLTLEDATGKKIKNYDQSYVPALTWKPSEFSTFRVSYQWDFERSGSESKLKNSFLEMQTTFILGAHPAHDF